MNNLENQPEIQTYLNSVTELIRFKEARPTVRRELLNHLYEMMEDGNVSSREALARMGNPEELGGQMDAVHRPFPDYVTMALTFLLCAGGLFALKDSGWLGLQALWMTIGTILLVMVYRLPLARLKQVLISLYPLAILGVASALLTGINHEGDLYLNLFGLKIKILDAAAVMISASFPALIKFVTGKRFFPILVAAPALYFSVRGANVPALITIASGTLTAQQSGLGRWTTLLLGSFGCSAVLFSNLESASPSIHDTAHTDLVLSQLTKNFALVGVAAATLASAFLLHVSTSTTSVRIHWLRNTVRVCALIFALEIGSGLLINFGFMPAPKHGMNFPFLSYGGSLLVLHLMMVGVLLSIFRQRYVHFPE